MGKVERKIRQTIRREAKADFDRIKSAVAKHRPWWLPKFIWIPLVEAVLDSRIQDIKQTREQ